MPEFAPDPRAEALREAYGYDIIGRDSLNLLVATATAAPRRRILELGCSVGYSALCLATATGAHVDTVEIDRDKLSVAQRLWAECGVSDMIDGYLGDALTVAPMLAATHKYDFVFIDAAKSKYGAYLDAIYPFIDTGTIIFADDVNYFGLVRGEDHPPHKHRTIVNNMRAFLRSIGDATRFDSEICDVGNGVAICTKI